MRKTRSLFVTVAAALIFLSSGAVGDDAVRSGDANRPDEASGSGDWIAVTAGAIAANPALYYGKRVKVSAEVEEALSPHLFTLDEDRVLAGPDVLVIAPARSRQAPADTHVTVRGTLRPLVVTDLERDYDWFGATSIQPDLVLRFKERPVIMADSIRDAGGEQLVARDEANKQAAAKGSAASEATAGGSAAAPHRLTGKVAGLDHASGDLSLVTDGGTNQLRFPPQALQGVKSGDRMTVTMIFALPDSTDDGANQPLRSFAADQPLRGEHWTGGTVSDVDSSTGMVDIKTDGGLLKVQLPPKLVADLESGEKIALNLAFESAPTAVR